MIIIVILFGINRCEMYVIIIDIIVIFKWIVSFGLLFMSWSINNLINIVGNV